MAVLKLIENPALTLYTGFEIATHWSPMRPKTEHWRLKFQNWSPAGDSRLAIQCKSTLFLERPRIIGKDFRKSMATHVGSSKN